MISPTNQSITRNTPSLHSLLSSFRQIISLVEIYVFVGCRSIIIKKNQSDIVLQLLLFNTCMRVQSIKMSKRQDNKNNKIEVGLDDGQSKVQSSSTETMNSVSVGLTALMSPWKVRVLGSHREISTEASLNSIHPFNPRQFEYHPHNPNLMVFGTLTGQVVVLNHTQNKIHHISKSHQQPANDFILGLSWLHGHTHQDKFVVGSSQGTVKLCSMNSSNGSVFTDFPTLSSVHVNMTDQSILVSGRSHSVRIYDLGTGQTVRDFDNIHSDQINLSRSISAKMKMPCL